MIKWIKRLFKRKEINKKPMKSQIVISSFFNKNNIFPDTYFFYKPLNIDGILQTYNSYIIKYPMGRYTIGSWIDEISQRFNINPRIIICLLEKNNMITTTNPISKETLDFALGLGVSKFELISKQYKGLDKQIFYISQNIRRRFDLYSIKNCGKVNCIDDNDIVSKNAFTYALYMIEPYVGTNDFYLVQPVKDNTGIVTGINKELKYKAPFGVYKFWAIWNEWFEK